MFISTAKICRILLLAQCVAACSATLRAQWFSSSGISGPISPPLTDNKPISPVTNLNVYFLVPPQPTLNDPTGSYVFATSISPLANSFALNTPAVQTDTALRSAGQAGQFNSFGLNSERLTMLGAGTNLAIPDYIASTASLGRSRSDTTTGFGNSNAESTSSFGQGSGSASSGESSSWGSSSQDFEPSAGSWGAAKLSLQRMGEGAGRGAEMSSSASSSEQNSNSDFQSPPLGIRGEALASTSGLLSQTSGSLGVNAKALSANSHASAVLGQASISSRNRMEAALAHGGSVASGSGNPAPSGHGPGTPKSTGAPETLEELLLFSPRSYIGYSFGETPFTSPGGYGDRAFLKPNILDTTPIVLSSGKKGNSEERWQELHHTLNGMEGSATGTSGSRASAGLGARYTHLGANPLSQAEKKNPYLNGHGLSSSNNPYSPSPSK